MDGEPGGVGIAQVVVEIQVHDLTGVGGKLGVVLVQDPADIGLASGLRRISGVFRRHDGNGLYGVLLDNTVAFIVRLRQPPLHHITVGGHTEISHAVHVEGAVSCEVGVGAVRHDEEVAPGHHQVRGLAGGLCGALAVHLGGNGCDLDAQTDLLGVGTTDICVGAGSVLGSLIEQGIKGYGIGFIAYCIDVGNVIADDVHFRLVGLQSGDAGKE